MHPVNSRCQGGGAEGRRGEEASRGSARPGGRGAAGLRRGDARAPRVAGHSQLVSLVLDIANATTMGAVSSVFWSLIPWRDSEGGTTFSRSPKENDERTEPGGGAAWVVCSSFWGAQT